MLNQSFMTQIMPLLPELILICGAMALLMIGAFGGNKTNNSIVGISLTLLITASFLAFIMPAPQLYKTAFLFDDFARVMKMLSFIAAAIVLILSLDYFKHENIVRFEYPILVLLSCAGMGVMISSTDLITLYLGLELQSLALYVIAAIHRDSAKASEAGLKYFALGALSSGLLLYGGSLLYGFTGTTELEGIKQAFINQGVSIGLIFGMVFVLVGIAFKVSAVPFHMWTPDVYEGAPTPVTAFFSAAPKVAAMALLIRLVIDGFDPAHHEWQQIIIFMSIASMALGAFAAIGQNNIKRLMAYSSIANMGFALVGLAAATQTGVRGLIIYMIIYLIMTLGVFACLLALRTKEGYISEISDLAGLSQTRPLIALTLSLLMFSLAGIPPLGGFFAKYYVFLAAIEANLYPLAIIGVLASVVAAFYYLRIIKIIYFDDKEHDFVKAPIELNLIYMCSGLLVFFFFLYAGSLQNYIDQAALSIF